MSSNTLIVPVLIPNGSLQFSTIPLEGTAQDVIASLIQLDEVKKDVLGDLICDAWALQRIRRERSGRPWEEDELEALGDGEYRLYCGARIHLLSSCSFTGILDPSMSMQPLINAAVPSQLSQRQFSAFPLTSHLHTPTVRLVALHPSLSIALSFLKVPEVHDGFTWRMFFSRTATVQDTIDSIVEELGLTKSLPVPGGGILEYALEEAWIDGHEESQFLSFNLSVGILNYDVDSARLPATSSISHILEVPHVFNPLSKSATRRFYLCVPDEWYRRSKFRHVTSHSYQPSDATIKRLAELQESDSEGDADGTAKQKGSVLPNLGSPKGSFDAGAEWRGTIAQNRLSNLFDSWRNSASSSGTIVGASNRMSVSEPKLLQHQVMSRTKAKDADNSIESESEESEPDTADFEEMLVGAQLHCSCIISPLGRTNWASRENSAMQCTSCPRIASGIFCSRTRKFELQHYPALPGPSQGMWLKDPTLRHTDQRVLLLLYRASCRRSLGKMASSSDSRWWAGVQQAASHFHLHYPRLPRKVLSLAL